MKKITLISALWALLLVSCKDPGKIDIENQLSNVEISNAKWGDIVVAGNMLPGQKSATVEIDPSKLPSSKTIQFTLRANGKTVFLETKDEYFLDEEQHLSIVLDDSTRVK